MRSPVHRRPQCGDRYLSQNSSTAWGQHLAETRRPSQALQYRRRLHPRPFLLQTVLVRYLYLRVNLRAHPGELNWDTPVHMATGLCMCQLPISSPCKVNNCTRMFSRSHTAKRRSPPGFSGSKIVRLCGQLNCPASVPAINVCVHETRPQIMRVLARCAPGAPQLRTWVPSALS